MPVHKPTCRLALLGSISLLPLPTVLAAETSAPAPATVPTPDRDIAALMRPLRTAPAPVEKAADGTVVPQTMTSPSGKKLTLQFHDEFDAVPDTRKDGKPYIDRAKWQTTFWQGSSIRTLGANGEAQYYMDKDYGGANNIPLEQRPNPFSFEKPGVLTISATKTPQELWSNYWMGEQRPFSSGLLISDKRFVFQYGYIEGRFKLPKNRGAWPAFWLLPNNPARSTDEAKNHPWPPEIDILEAFGHAPTKFSTNIHSPKNQKVKLSKFMHDMGTDLTQDFHTWGLEWDAERVVYYFDGKEVSRAEITDAFRQPMYLLVNLAVGGNWYADDMKAAKTPYKAWEVDEASMPWKMECDYVRVYQDPTNLYPAIAESTILPKPVPGVTAPTPYPDPKTEAAWAGQGPIRVHDWMKVNREWFWAARERDQNSVVFVGDSLIGGWKADQLSKAFPGLKVSNRGIGGDVSRGLLYRWKEDVLDLKPRAIVLLIGTNDLSTHANPSVVEHNVGLMIDAARAQNPQVPIVLGLVPPRAVADAPIKPGALADLNARLTRLGAEKAVEVADLYTPLATAEGKPLEPNIGKDGIHITAAGYEVWKGVLAPVFEKLGLNAAAAPAAVVADGRASAATGLTAAPTAATTGSVPGLDGPTPYPAATNEAAWPGKGPIRVHSWMKQQRGWFWTARERDQNSVVFAGSSSTANWKVAEISKAFPNLKVSNRGLGGDVSRGLLFRWKEDVLDLNPRAIVLLIGSNDLSTHADPALTEHNISLMLDQAKAHNPKLPVILCLNTPRNVPDAPIKAGAMEELNSRIRKLGEGRDNVLVLDLFTPFATPEGMPLPDVIGKDGIHIAAPGYKMWADLLRPAFSKLNIQ